MELGRRWSERRRRSRWGRLPVEDARDLVGVDRDVEDAHATTATLEGTDGDLDREDAPQEP